MAFPEIYKAKVDVGSYIPEDRLDSAIKKILNRINKIVADVRKNLTTIAVERETVDISVDLVRQLIITVPFGTTNEEKIKINKAIKEEVMVVQVSIPASVLDQKQEFGAEEYNGIDDISSEEYSIVKIFQTFTVGLSGDLAKVEIFQPWDISYGTLVVNLKNVDINGLPIGPVLSTTTGEILENGWMAFNFVDNIQGVTEGTKYALEFDFSRVMVGHVVIFGAASETEDFYLKGKALKSRNDILEEYSTAYTDLTFRTYILSV